MCVCFCVDAKIYVIFHHMPLCKRGLILSVTAAKRTLSSHGRRPLGVIGVIAPWNYPFHNVYNHIVSGIFAGNAVVSKVSEYTCWSSRYGKPQLRSVCYSFAVAM